MTSNHPDSRPIHDLIISLRSIMREMDRMYNRYQSIEPQAIELYMQLAYAYRMYYREESLLRERLGMPMLRKEPEWVSNWIQRQTNMTA